MSKRYNNYHKHTHYSNLATLDSCTKPIEYINRAKELGHTTYFTTEHGWQGNIFEAYRLCKENDIKPIYGAEVYYVDDASVKDERRMYHLILIAMTNKGRKQINKIISKAYTDGFYYKARIDLSSLLSLSPEDVVVTTACIATRMFVGNDWKEKFFLPVFEHFRNHFFLEVQDHDEDIQRQLNKNILELRKQYDVGIIHANDSHYIYPKDSEVRNAFLKAKGMDYGDESTFILDYPDYDEIVFRYKKQGILNDDEIEEALNNTLIFDQAEEIGLDYDVKLPHIFKENSNAHLKRVLLKEFKNKILSQNLPKERIDEYKKALNYEFNIIVKCHMADYFLLNYYIVKKAVDDYGAVLTRTGRGSAVSFLINYLLGFTQIDRLKSPIKLYPTRFMSAERILKAKSLPDIDLNWKDVEPVLKASKDYMGEDGVYYMVSYKPMQEASAFRLWCKSQGLHVGEYDEVAKSLESYVDDPKWSKYIEDSKSFVGVIESVSPSPCSVLLLDKPISEEIGLMKVGDVICCSLDGINCDYFKYLKDDFLIVSVYTLIDETYKMIGRPIDDISTLLKNCDDKVWEIIDNAITTTINQCDSDYDKQILKKYKPKSLSELSAYVASIRPGFKSLLQNFIERKPYSTGVDELDNLLKDSFHYMMYQENIMTYLTWLGIDEKETYDIIKKISKKKFKEKELKELKVKLKNGWMRKVKTEKGFDDTWLVMTNASSYAFNASHSLSVALDALYGAYLKSHYPLEYYTVALTEYSGDEKRTNNLISELPYFDIELKPARFRYAQSGYSIDKKNNNIIKGIGSVKYLNETISDEMYALRDNEYDDFVDLLIDLSNTSLDTRQLDILIDIDFFEEFGDINKLHKTVEIFHYFKNKKQLKKSKLIEDGYDIELIKGLCNKETNSLLKEFNDIEIIKVFVKNADAPETTLNDRIVAHYERLGYFDLVVPDAPKTLYYITGISGKKKIKIELYELFSGKQREVFMWKSDFERIPFNENEFITIKRLVKENKRAPGDKINKKTGKPIWVPVQGEYEFWLKEYKRGSEDVF